MDLSYIIAPLLGGVIGYITNDIAIRMLFRPHKAKYVFGIHIPFTPGIIPKEKGRIAEVVGGVISENLMNKEVLEKYLLSEDMIEKVRSAVEEFIATQQRNNETVVQFLEHYLSKEEIDTIAQNINRSITKQTYEKLADSSVGEKVAHIAIDHVAQKLTIDGAQELLSGIGGALGGIGGMADVNRLKNLWQMFGNDTSIYGLYSVDSLSQLFFVPFKQFAYRLVKEGINFATNHI